MTDTIYPIGSIYMSVNSTNPSVLFGGSWEQIQNRFLLAAGSSYAAGSTGGSADAVIVSHSHHAFDNTYFVETNATALATGSTKRVATSNSDGNYYWQTSTTQPTISRHTETATTGVSGTGKNMPPYLAVYVWKRTA